MRKKSSFVIKSKNCVNDSMRFIKNVVIKYNYIRFVDHFLKRNDLNYILLFRIYLNIRQPVARLRQIVYQAAIA